MSGGNTDIIFRMEVSTVNLLGRHTEVFVVAAQQKDESDVEYAYTAASIIAIPSSKEGHLTCKLQFSFPAF